MKPIKFSVIIPAAGTGRRAGGDVAKQWADLGGEPMVIRVLRSFAAIPGVSKIAVALHPDEYQARKAEIESFGVPATFVFCMGGKRRQDSVSNALEALEIDESEIVVIHDAARPFIRRALIEAVIEKADQGQAAIAAIPVNDTIKEIDRVGYIINTPPRTSLRAAQTPQAVRASVLHKGLQMAAQRDIELTDDAAAAELIGFRVSAVLGDQLNFKITSAEDLAFARYLLDSGTFKDE